MRLTQRLLLYALVVVTVLVAFTLVAVRERTTDGLRAETAGRVRAEASLAARAWTPGAAPVALADALGRELGRHVTLLDAGGRVIGDSETRDLAAEWLRAYATLPEVRAAAADAAGAAHGARSTAAGAVELAAAARGAAGVVRIATPLDAPSPIVGDVRRGVLVAGLAALILSAGLAVLFARAVVRPLDELRDVTRALASGDPTRRPALTAPGEVGDLATAVHRLAEQLGARLDALQAEEDLTRALTEALTEGIVAVDARQQVVRMNGVARQLLRLRDTVPFPADHLPRDRALREALQDAMRGAATDPFEVRLDDRILSLTARPLPAGGGAVLALLDLTPIRRLEAMRRDFVANVSHELKTPLTVVGGFAETLADDDAVPAAVRRQFAGTIRDNAHRMQRIVDDLLDLSRIESGGWQPVPTRVDVRVAAEEATAAARAAAAAKGVTVEIAPADDAPTLHADQTAVRQVLSNLVENAVRHTASGTVRVCTAAAPDGVWLRVCDTGAGIAAEHLPRIFERFYRADPGRAREQGGTGLGLAIVKHLVEAHGGEVRAESRLGAGTTIAVRFPSPS
jgi:two-component system phosphate regulon sensor histidine kinase PhoR